MMRIKTNEHYAGDEGYDHDSDKDCDDDNDIDDDGEHINGEDEDNDRDDDNDADHDNANSNDDTVARKIGLIVCVIIYMLIELQIGVMCKAPTKQYYIGLRSAPLII